MFHMGVYGAMYNWRQASEAQKRSIQADHEAGRATEAVRMLEERMDRLLLANMALWELLKDRTSLSEEDLKDKMQEIDLRDGQADGKITSQVAKCAQCGRTMSRKHRRCLYCGAEDSEGGAFDAAT